MVAVWRLAGEALRQLPQVNAMALLERRLPNPMLLGVMITAQTDRPAVRWLEADPAIGAIAHMRAFNGLRGAAGHAAVMTPHPGAMRWHVTPSALTSLTRDPRGQRNRAHATSRMAGVTAGGAGLRRGLLTGLSGGAGFLAGATRVVSSRRRALSIWPSSE